MLEHQGGVCAICKEPPTTKRLAVDHKHEKQDKKQPALVKRKNVRGLLCWICNRAIGIFKDNPNRLRAAAEYLETLPAKQIIKE